jgi:hypothetical protein
MSSENAKDIYALLKQLASSIQHEVQEAIRQDKLYETDTQYYRKEIHDFQYTELGPTIPRSSEHLFVKKTWRSGYLAHIINSIRQSAEYSSAWKLLAKDITQRQDHVTADNARVTAIGSLFNFVQRVARNSLPDTRFGQPEVDASITALIKTVRGESLNHSIKLELRGVVVAPEKLELTVKEYGCVLLRQVTAEDIEREFPADRFVVGLTEPYIGSPLDFLALPSAIARFECSARDKNEIAIRIRQVIALLRLFRVGGVTLISHSVLPEGGTRYSIGGLRPWSRDHLTAWEPYSVTEADQQRLIDFLDEMLPKLPAGFFDSRRTTHDDRTIAYQRYCDALLLRGSQERRIANAVMGLEALYIPSQTGEVAYKLRTRVARALGLLAYTPLEVREAVNQAYSVRSSFAHGNPIRKDTNRRVLREHGSLKHLAHKVLDYLRLSLVLRTTLELDKSKFAAIVDDSLIDRHKSDELQKLLESVQRFA